MYVAGVVADEGQVGHEQGLGGEAVLAHRGGGSGLVEQGPGGHPGHPLHLGDGGEGAGEAGQVRHGHTPIRAQHTEDNTPRLNLGMIRNKMKE